MLCIYYSVTQNGFPALSSQGFTQAPSVPLPEHWANISLFTIPIVSLFPERHCHSSEREASLQEVGSCIESLTFHTAETRNREFGGSDCALGTLTSWLSALTGRK